MNQVWSRSRNKGSALLLLLAIADHAHDDGGGAFPSVNSLARKTRMGVRSTQLLIQKLVTSGELEVEIGGGPKGCNLYRVNLKALGRGAKFAGGVQTLHPAKFAGGVQKGGAKSGAKGVQHVAPKPSCNEGTVMHEPSLQQQQSDDSLPAAADRFNDNHKSIFSSYTVEDFVKATKPHSTNPGGLARMLWRSGAEDSAISQWMLAKEKQNKREEQPAPPDPEIAADFDMDDWVDDLIANNWIAQLENELEQINERGGPKLPWERKVVAYFNRGAETDAA